MSLGGMLRLDADGRLIDGDEAALELNQRAGGRVGSVLAVPALNDVVRLARRLRAPVSRSVAAADLLGVWQVQARARPEGPGISLTLADWKEAAPVLPVEDAVPPVEAPPAARPQAVSEQAPALARPLDRALRGPLDRIVADADALTAEGRLGPTYAGYAADIAGAGRHLLALIGDLADLEQVERPDLPLMIERVDLADLARRAGGLLTVRAAGAGVGLRRPAPDQRLHVRGDHRRCLQILLNLVGNAVRYAPAGSSVTLFAEAMPGAGRVTVVDQGPGIAAADQARVFNKFERLNPGEAGGTGLGLYIARRLARAMGGDVTLASEAGQGARFALTLPAAPQQQG